jgi:hypothetical protein
MNTKAMLLISGPEARSEYCEGCSLYGATEKAKDSCPYFGDAYRETEGDAAGLLFRPLECLENERRVSVGVRGAEPMFRRWVESPARDKMNQTKVPR